MNYASRIDPGKGVSNDKLKVLTNKRFLNIFDVSLIRIYLHFLVWVCLLKHYVSIFYYKTHNTNDAIFKFNRTMA